MERNCSKRTCECFKITELNSRNTRFWKKDKYDYDFSDLLSELCKIDNLKRIRISSIEITELDSKFIDVLKNNKVIVNHMHIPLQSGCDKTLKEMNRKYDTKYYLDKINLIRSIRPNISITTDLIVGFPNETEEDFNNTLSFLRKVKFSKIHVFPYSRRKGTKADLMDNQIDEQTKHKRVKEVLKLSEELEIPSNYFEPIRNLNNILCYLIHYKEENKFHYDLTEVKEDIIEENRKNKGDEE